MQTHKYLMVKNSMSFICSQCRESRSCVIECKFYGSTPTPVIWTRDIRADVQRDQGRTGLDLVLGCWAQKWQSEVALDWRYCTRVVWSFFLRGHSGSRKQVGALESQEENILELDNIQTCYLGSSALLVLPLYIVHLTFLIGSEILKLRVDLPQVSTKLGVGDEVSRNLVWNSSMMAKWLLLS